MSVRKSALLLPLTMYRPRPLQRCSTGLALLLTTLTWFLLCVCLGGWYRELGPKRWVFSPHRQGRAGLGRAARRLAMWDEDE